MTAPDFRLPDVGEGLTEAEVVRWLVSVGDTVALNDPLVEVETSKSLVELPSPFAGEIAELLVDEGEVVPVGTVIVRFVGRAEPAPAERPKVLVGYGPAGDSEPKRRPRKPAIAAPTAPRSGGVRAKPPVRKLAKDLGVDLSEVRPTGPNETVLREDVTAYRARSETPQPSGEKTPQPSGEKRWAGTRVPITGVRRATAEAMCRSAFTAPHVTEFLTVDATRTAKLVKRMQLDPAFDGTKVTPLTVVAAALLSAVRRHPEINASWDADAGEIVRYDEVNLGIAAATARGLVVPNIKGADRLRLPELAASITELTSRAKAGETTPSNMSRGTITITNIGVFGVDTGTPILNPGEAAILCLGAIRRQPWEHRGRVKLRGITQLALSFDHRLVDGDLGSRVLAHVGRVLENPRWELLLG